MNNSQIKGWKFFIRKLIPVRGCFNRESSSVFLFWKLILMTGLVLILVAVFSFSSWRKTTDLNLEDAGPISDSLTLNRGALSEVFENYKKEEELFKKNIESISSINDPS